MEREEVLNECEDIVTEIIELQSKLVDVANRVAKLRLEIFRNWNE